MTVGKRFRALRFIAVLFKVIAWLILLAGIVSAGFIFVSGVSTLLDADVIRSTGVVTSVLGGAISLGALFTAIFYFLVFFAASEAIYLQISIEENTRLTSMLLRKISEEDTSASKTELPSY